MFASYCNFATTPDEPTPGVDHMTAIWTSCQREFKQGQAISGFHLLGFSKGAQPLNDIVTGLASIRGRPPGRAAKAARAFAAQIHTFTFLDGIGHHRSALTSEATWMEALSVCPALTGVHVQGSPYQWRDSPQTTDIVRSTNDMLAALCHALQRREEGDAATARRSAAVPLIEGCDASLTGTPVTAAVRTSEFLSGPVVVRCTSYWSSKESVSNPLEQQHFRLLKEFDRSHILAECHPG